ncbi:hypothetical protein [Ruminococcus flavefaciens]|uniref:hypothetical protein n=1 Tax=Ruminococcus flavefaciens TaxID=1265 RepID=UPI00048CC77F|nr:hypothetical protein [Ruminococcus flavefaciens]
MSKLKSYLRTIRFPEDIVADIEREAEETGKDFSKVVIYRLRNYHKPLTPDVMVKIQNIVNHALACVLKGSRSIQGLQREVNELWKYLRYGDMHQQQKSTDIMR